MGLERQETMDRQPDWKIFEQIVTQIHKTLSPKAEVVHDDRIFGQDSKKKRQIDISIRQTIGPHRILIIVQCRHYKRKIDVNGVGEFATVIKDVHANMGVMVSNAGFTDGAINLAKSMNINLCSIFDAQNEDWSVVIKLAVVCDFRKPIIHGKLRITGAQPFSIPADVNKLELVDEKGQAISFRKVFFQDWNSGKVSIEVGEREYIPNEGKLFVKQPNGRLAPITVSFNVCVQARLFFGYMGLEKSQGIVSVTDHSYTTKEITMEGIDVVEVEKSWMRIASLKEVPQPPFMVLVATDLFPLEGHPLRKA